MLDPVVNLDDLWADARVVAIGDSEVRVASIRHLIRMKEAAGRAQDLADAGRLRELLAE